MYVSKKMEYKAFQAYQVINVYKVNGIKSTIIKIRIHTCAC